MKVVVLGGGVIGVTTAYYLAEYGHDVTVIDRQPEVASETSYGNAGLVSPGDSYAWASPGSLKTFLKSVFGGDLGLKLVPQLDPRLWSWLVQFLFQCTYERARVNTLRKLRIAMYARERINELVAKTGIHYDGRNRGIIYFYRSQEALDQGAAHMQILHDHGLKIEVMDRAGLQRAEPALKSAGDKLAGGIFSPMDQTGDCRLFSRNLATWLEQNKGVTFSRGTKVIGLNRESGRIREVLTGDGTVSADAFVLAMGCDSPALARQIGVSLPIYPVKGYSITVPVTKSDRAPRMGGVDEDRLVAYSRLGERLRVSASAEFSGYSRAYQPSDFRRLLATAQELFPEAGDYGQAEYWAGLRPMTPSSVPILGRAGAENFFLNVGHGHVGWTMSCGSGKFVADLVSGRVPEIDAEGLLYEA